MNSHINFTYTAKYLSEQKHRNCKDTIYFFFISWCVAERCTYTCFVPRKRNCRYNINFNFEGIPLILSHFLGWGENLWFNLWPRNHTLYPSVLKINIHVYIMLSNIIHFLSFLLCWINFKRIHQFEMYMNKLCSSVLLIISGNPFTSIASKFDRRGYLFSVVFGTFFFARRTIQKSSMLVNCNLFGMFYFVN